MPEKPNHSLTSAKILRVVLGDQLNIGHSWFASVDPEVVYLMAELRSETDYAKHHIQKVVAFFTAMRLFAEQLETLGHRVVYIRIDDEGNPGDFPTAIRQVARELGVQEVSYQLPDEYRLDRALSSSAEGENYQLTTAETEHFYTTRTELADFFKGKKLFLMENFYRAMRRKHAVLMDGAEPATGQWNYDHDNRQKLPDSVELPNAKLYLRDVSEVVAQIERAGAVTIGRIEPTRFVWPVTRAEALDLLEHFTEHLLPRFGAFQDALTTRDWSLFHSRLSFAMNVKLIGPREVVDHIEQRWRRNTEHATIAQVEGFIRQILGWREYMRGIYWAKMPEYANLNFFKHERTLPDWFWTGNTKMRCLSHAINQSLDYAYAHHIQRLMVTGNFALLAGIHPDEVDAWYLGIYIDAIEWVEITNTRGMSQFADGGIVGSKPYVSSANYIHKMGNYCTGCHYKQAEKTGEKACPFNSLYWHFYARNREKLERNPRIGMMYRTWDKMQPAAREALLKHADSLLENLNAL